MPLSASAGTIGRVPPERVRIGLIPKALLERVLRDLDHGRVGGDESRPRRARQLLDVDRGALGRGLVQQALDLGRDGRRRLSGREPDGEVRLRLADHRRVLEPGLAAENAAHLDGGLGGRAEVELLRRLRVVRHRPGLTEDVDAGRLHRPARALLLGDRRDPDAKRIRHAAVARQDPGECLVQRVDRVQRRVAVHPGVEVALAGLDAQVEGGEPAGRDRERRQRARLHAAVEDHAGVGAALVLLEELDDRLAADLLLAVRDEADVDRERSVGGEQAGRVQQHPELALVVRDAARVEPLVADRRLERIRLPERRAAPAAARRSGRSRGRSARPWRRSRRGISPTTSGRSPYGTSSASPPLRRTLSATHSAAWTTSPACAGSALTDGMLSSSPSSSSHSWGRSLTAASLVRPARAAVHQATSRSWAASASARSFFRPWFSICRIRSRVTLNALPTSSSVRGCSPSSP